MEGMTTKTKKNINSFFKTSSLVERDFLFCQVPCLPPRPRRQQTDLYNAAVSLDQWLMPNYPRNLNILKELASPSDQLNQSLLFYKLPGDSSVRPALRTTSETTGT